MLTVHVVRPGGHEYYLVGNGPDRSDDRVPGERPGEWAGGGSADLGLSGAVTPPEFGELLEGRHPGSAEPLRRRAGGHPVAGFDLTFAAPKSVSILHLLAPREIAVHVGAGHRAAVSDAAGYLDRAAVGVRRRRGDQVTLLSSTGSVAGGFVHRTSRALDPHLHTHLVVANVARGVDGRWSSVDSRRVFAHLPAVQAVYHARLRLELTQRFGAAWDVRPSGLADVVGVPPGLRGVFSQRTSAMAEYEHSRFGTVRHAGDRRGSFHATRPDKDTTRSVEELRDQWRLRAADLGYHLGDLTTVVGRAGRATDRSTLDTGRLRAGVERLASTRNTVTRRDLVALVGRASVGGGASRSLEDVAHRLVEAAGPALERPGRDGRPVVHGLEPRWSTREVARSLDGGLAAVVEGAGRHRAATGPEDGQSLVRARDRPAVVPDRGTEPGRHRRPPDLGR